jgi:divalent metal cation (Fe/Co/Zn/Cd) transporter
MAAPANPAPPARIVSSATRAMRSAWLVSLASVAWTFVASALAIVIGARDGSAVLIAVGAIGYIDLLGSVALVYHFRHALRHEELSDRLERIAHRTVLFGLLVVGLAAIILSALRLLTGSTGGMSSAGIVLAASSVVVLSTLALQKLRVAARVGSPALRADGQLSAIGALQAAVALAGIAAVAWADWHWADPVAAIAVGCIAVAVAISTWRAERSSTADT